MPRFRIISGAFFFRDVGGTFRPSHLILDHYQFTLIREDLIMSTALVIT